jgi:hypothetical protein
MPNYKLPPSLREHMVAQAKTSAIAGYRWRMTISR